MGGMLWDVQRMRTQNANYEKTAGKKRTKGGKEESTMRVNSLISEGKDY